MQIEWVPLVACSTLPAVSGVYVIRHRVTGKMYVGQSKNVRKRMSGHIAARSRTGYFPSAIRKHGATAFDVCLWTACEIADLGRIEIALIQELGTFAPAGYNSSLGGAGPTGSKRTVEWCARQSARCKGIPQTEEAKAKMRSAALSNNAFKGKKHTAEAKAKMAEATKRLKTGVKFTPQHLANMSAALKGRAAPVLSPEARARQAAAQRVPNAKKSQPGEKNGMYGKVGPLTGRKGGQHPSSKTVAVWVTGSFVPRIFGSGVEAAAWAGFDKKKVTGWCLGQHKPSNGWVWAYL